MRIDDDGETMYGGRGSGKGFVWLSVRGIVASEFVRFGLQVKRFGVDGMYGLAVV
jgi:hypothetical protein